MADVDFFISFAEPDLAWAEWIASVVESAGYRTFVHSRDVLVGESLIQGISEALENATRTIVVLSPHLENSTFGDAEWRAGFMKDPTNERGTLLPVRVAPFEPRGLLATRIYVDLVGVTEEEARARLLEAIGRSRRRPSAFPGSAGASQSVTKYEKRAPAAKAGKGSVFVSYSHRDRKWLERLLVHLKPLERSGQLVIWEDSKIKAGSPWKDEIDKALQSAHIAILLISADFLASEFISNNEVPKLLMGAQDRGTIVMPVIVSPSRFGQTESLSKFQAVNAPDKALTRMTTHQREEFFVGLASAIEDAIASFS